MAVHAGAAERKLTMTILRRMTIAATVAAAAMTAPAVAHADALGYLINITVRPGYHFANSDAAVAYGYGICDKIHSGMRYGPLLAGIMADQATDDEYQAAYLVNQAAEMLCPAEIWQLRQSAIHYTGPATQ